MSLAEIKRTAGSHCAKDIRDGKPGPTEANAQRVVVLLRMPPGRTREQGPGMSFVEWLPAVRLISTKNIPDPVLLPPRA